MFKLLLLTTAVAACSLSLQANTQNTLSAADMNHLMYTPTTRVNDKEQITLSLHEAAYGLGGGLQAQFSFFDNVGRINFGVKYALNKKTVLGAGLAGSFARLHRGHHGLHGGDRRIGLFATQQLSGGNNDIYITAHSQLGKVSSLGADLGFQTQGAKNWSFMAEAGTSYDTNSNFLYANANLGLRVFPSNIKNLYFDGGLDVVDFVLLDGINEGHEMYYSETHYCVDDRQDQYGNRYCYSWQERKTGVDGVSLYLDVGYHL